MVNATHVYGREGDDAKDAGAKEASANTDPASADAREGVDADASTGARDEHRRQRRQATAGSGNGATECATEGSGNGATEGSGGKRRQAGAQFCWVLGENIRIHRRGGPGLRAGPEARGPRAGARTRGPGARARGQGTRRPGAQAPGPMYAIISPARCRPKAATKKASKACRFYWGDCSIYGPRAFGPRAPGRLGPGPCMQKIRHSGLGSARIVTRRAMVGAKHPQTPSANTIRANP